MLNKKTKLGRIWEPWGWWWCEHVQEGWDQWVTWCNLWKDNKGWPKSWRQRGWSKHWLVSTEQPIWLAREPIGWTWGVENHELKVHPWTFRWQQWDRGKQHRCAWGQGPGEWSPQKSACQSTCKWVNVSEQFTMGEQLTEICQALSK